MPTISPRERRVLEIFLIAICLGLACLLYMMQGYKMAILNLFFLPVALGGFFLGRYVAGVLALFSALAVSLVTSMVLPDLSLANSPLIIALAITVWAAALGLTAMLVGTLSEDREAKTKELHDAYVGVIEVLSQYLQSGHPRLKTRSIRVAELSQEVGFAMRLSPRQIDNIRVAALLYDLGQIEVTTRVVQRAVDTLGEEAQLPQKWTFQGLDLVLSLGTVLREAIPLLLTQDRNLPGNDAARPSDTDVEIPVGSWIIRAARSYVTLASEPVPEGPPSCAEICHQIRREAASAGEREVVDALERVVCRAGRSPLAAISPDAVALTGPVLETLAAR